MPACMAVSVRGSSRSMSTFRDSNEFNKAVEGGNYPEKSKVVSWDSVYIYIYISSRMSPVPGRPRSPRMAFLLPSEGSAFCELALKEWAPRHGHGKSPPIGRTGYQRTRAMKYARGIGGGPIGPY